MIPKCEFSFLPRNLEESKEGCNALRGRPVFWIIWNSQRKSTGWLLSFLFLSGISSAVSFSVSRCGGKMAVATITKGRRTLFPSLSAGRLF